MNKKVMSIVAALCVTTAAQADILDARTTFPPATHPTVFRDAEIIKAQAELFSKNKPLLEAEISLAHDKARFERAVATGFLSVAAVATVTFLSCAFMEWLQEYKVRKAEKAKLVAELQSKTRHIQVGYAH